jgi:hypothetical protein
LGEAEAVSKLTFRHPRFLNCQTMPKKHQHVESIKRDLLIKFFESSNTIIHRLDDQLNLNKTVCASVWTALTGWILTQTNREISILILLQPILFCLVAVDIKKVQRGYIVTQNYVKKMLIQSPDAFLKRELLSPTISTILADQSGHYYQRVNDDFKDYFQKWNTTARSYMFVAKFYFIILCLSVFVVLIKYCGSPSALVK